MKKTANKIVQNKVVQMLSIDSTIPEKVKVEDIIIFNNGKKSHALSGLITHCKEMEQGLVLKADFIKKRDVIECVICHDGFRFEDELDSEGRCHKCLIEIEREEKRKQAEGDLIKKWKQLENDLQKFNGAYILLFDIEGNGKGKIKRTVKIQGRKDPIVFEIYRGRIYSSVTKMAIPQLHALRISSDCFSLDGRKLKKDFNGKNVAKGLHNKIEKLIKQKETGLQTQKIRKQKEGKFTRLIMEDLKVPVTDIENSYYFPRGRMRSAKVFTDTKKVKYQGMLLNAYYTNEKVKYSIGGISVYLTIKQIKEIANIIK